MSNYKSIGERIRLIRKNNGMTQEYFGMLTGISHSHVSNIENGKENPSNTLIIVICSKFNVEKEWLLYGEGDMISSDTDAKCHDEAERLDELLLLYKKLFNSTNSLTKKEIYNQIIADILSALVFDSYYYEVDLEDPIKLEYLSHFVDILNNITQLTRNAREILAHPNKDDTYKKLYDIQKVYDGRINTVIDDMRKLISSLCKEAGIEF